MEEQRAFMVWSQDQFGDQHLFSTGDFDRASAAYHAMRERYGNAVANEGLEAAMSRAGAG